MQISVTNALKNYYNLIIIGSGPAGLSTAITFNKLNPEKKILVIESGDKDYNESINSLGKIDAKGDLNSEFLELSSQRIYGGTSCYWGGWCATFEEFSFIRNKWPISYKEIYKYYNKASKILELDELSYENASTPLSQAINYKPWFFSQKKAVRFGEKYEYLFKENNQIHILLKTTVSKLNINDYKINSIELKNSLDSNIHNILDVKNSKVVIAAGGIGNANILLQSNYSNNELGKNLMEHPHLYSQIRYSINKKIFDTTEITKTRVVHGCQLNSLILESNNVPINATYEFSKNSLVDEIINGKPYILYETKTHLRTEMTPKESNKVYLDSKKNHLGLYNMKVDFNFDYNEIEQNIKLFSSSLLRNSIGRPYIVKKPYQVTGGNHLIGTTKMGLTQHDSVVDSNLKIHDIENCYLTGASVFPTSDASNPTYTVVAISIRLAEHLSKL